MRVRLATVVISLGGGVSIKKGTAVGKREESGLFTYRGRIVSNVGENYGKARKSRPSSERKAEEGKIWPNGKRKRGAMSCASRGKPQKKKTALRRWRTRRSTKNVIRKKKTVRNEGVS